MNYYYLFTILGIALTALGYGVAMFRKGSSDGANAVILLLQQEVAALKSRLETTSAQVTQLNSQSISMNVSLSELHKENEYLKKLINEALLSYFGSRSEVLTEIKTKIQ